MKSKKSGNSDNILNDNKGKINQTGTENTLRYYNLMYAIALSVIAIISFVSQVLIQSYLENQQHDSHLINYAARLRSNSQTLSKLALKIESGRDFETHRKDFRTTLMQWERTHNSLIEGNEFLSLPVNKNEDMAELFGIINGPYNEILHAGKEMVNIMYRETGYKSEELLPYIHIILQNEKAYFLGMEMIVFDYDRISRQNVVFLKNIEKTLLWSIMGMLILEAIFIFRPLARRIKITFNNLLQAEINATQLANELGETNRYLENSHKELREINLALEKTTYLVKIDAGGEIIYANNKYCHVTKYEMSDLRGKPLFYNNMGGEENIIYEHINDPARKKEVWQGEIFDHASDGTGFWLDVTLMPIIDNRGTLYQYLIIGFDITKRKKTERKLTLLMEEKMKRQQEVQKVRSQSIIAGQEKERKRVAAEIHDGIGQMLTSLGMRIEMLEEENPDAFSEMVDVNLMLTDIIGETRRICAELLPSVLEDFGLIPAINELIEGISKNSLPNVEFKNSFEMREVSPEIEIGIYRIMQESINNVIKHACAKNLKINLESDAEFVYLEIQDDGIGFNFDEKSIFEEENGSNTHGLNGMRERAELLGADFELKSALNQGTKIKVEIPI